MSLWEIVPLFLAAALAGGLNSVAGGGSFIGLPALAFFGGLETKIANATNSVALWPGSLSSAIAYRNRINFRSPVTIGLCVMSVIGGTLGAIVLLQTSQSAFSRVLPWLMLFATALFAFGNTLTQKLRRNAPTSATLSPMALVGFGLVQFIIATYGGYFGGGQGFMMLALLSVMGMEDIHTMNGLKTLLATLINGASVVTFALAGIVVWPKALVMIVGAILGGYFGAHYAQQIPPVLLRRFVIGVGIIMTIIFFIRA